MILAEETSGNITVYVYDSEGLPLGMQYHGVSYAEDEWDVYWYEKNIFGDIVAVYNEAGTKLISYEYDAYGKFDATYYNGGINSTAYNNPFRYRGYYYDTDLALYYLNSRYYDAKTGRFISPDNIDVICATPTALTDKNLYAYCDNNPVMRRDDGGQFWETFFDVASLAFSVVDVCINPSDAWAWIGLAGDCIDLIPFVSCVGEATDVIRIATKVDDFVDAIDEIHDTARAIDNIYDSGKALDNTIDTYKSLKKVYKGTGLEVHHIVEKRFARDLDLENANDMLSIALTKSEHRAYTNAWRNKIGYRTGRHTRETIWAAAKEIYIDRPDLLEAARKTIFRR